MIVPDLNLLLYAVNQDAPQHKRSREWWEQTLGGDESVGLASPVISGFLRLTTRPALFAQPLSVRDSLDVVQGWIECPPVVLLHPGEQHWICFRALLENAGTGGNLTTDAFIAALVMEYGATLYSSDNDFRRFGPDLRFVNPLV